MILINALQHNGILTRSRSYLHKCYRLDARSLAVFRVLVAAVLMTDLVLRLQHATTFYADAGAFPRRLAIPVISSDRWSLLFLNGSTEFVTLFLLVGIVAALMMMLGYRTRLATVALWIVLVSVQARNNHLLSGADTLMRVTLFWGMFLPLGTRWSIDAMQRSPGVHTKTKTPSAVSSVATFGLILQAACLYLFTAIQKSGPRWHEDGTAVYYALGARDLSNTFGNWLFHNAPDTFFRISTFGTLVLEYAVPLLLLLPIRSGWLRGIGVASVIVLQLGIGTSMAVGLFPAIGIASVIAIVPSGVWNFLEAHVFSRALFVRLQTRWNRALTALLPGDQAESEERRPAADVESGDPQVVGFLPLGTMERRVNKHSILNIVCGVAVILVVLWNVSTVSSYEVPDPARRVAVAAGLYQNWSMFAPSPQASTVWFVVEGTLTSGDKVDVLRPIVEGDLSIRSATVADQSDKTVVDDKYWRKYFHAIWERENDLLAFAGYACRSWNAEFSGEDRLESLTITRAYARTLPNSERAEPAFTSVGSWTCN